MVWHRAFLVCLLACLPGCALSAPPPEQTLALPGAAAHELDRLAERALAAARAAPDDVALQVAAAQRLFQAADRRLQRATLTWLEAHPAATRAEVLAAEDRVDDADRTSILSLCTTGLELAQQALAAEPDDVSAALHVALHLSLVAWANGPTRALFAGHGPKLVAAIDAVLALDHTFDGGAPLRLQGRFRGQAPWPYGDRELARKSLAEAVELRSVPVNHRFFGDVLAAAGEVDAALQQWQLAVEAPADESTRWSADLLRDLARRRLAAAR
jgi:hypothetical protein